VRRAGPWATPLFGLATVAAPTAAQLAHAQRLFQHGAALLGTQDTQVFAHGRAPPSDGARVELALVGRSNAGKSTLVNRLVSARVASVSARPGHTREAMFYRVGPRTAPSPLVLVDLPGYGHATGRGRSQRDLWMMLISRYLVDRAAAGVLRRAVVLLDVRRGLTDLDQELLELMDAAPVPYLVVATKADTLAPAARDAAVQLLAARLGGRQAAFPTLHLVSAHSGDGWLPLLRTMALVAGLE
jgi:GTP-binding protein